MFPDKSLLLKEYLPDGYDCKYRPYFNEYKKFLSDKIIDTYEVLKNYEDVYYKTDSHINLKGQFVVFNAFIDKLKLLYQIHLNKLDLNNLHKVNINRLVDTGMGLGDLTWKNNLGEQYLDDISDTYYFDPCNEQLYTKYSISDNGIMQFFKIDNNELINATSELRDKLFDWNVVSNYIISFFNKKYHSKKRVLIFYDSFTLFLFPYLKSISDEVFLIKDIFSENIVSLINPDLIFEFRVERYLL